MITGRGEISCDILEISLPVCVHCTNCMIFLPLCRNRHQERERERERETQADEAHTHKLDLARHMALLCVLCV